MINKIKKNNIDEEKIIEELQHASPVKTGKRFQSFFIDCVLLLFVSYFIFLGSNAIATNTNAYKNASSIVNDEIRYYNNYIEESRVMDFTIVNGEKTRDDLIIDSDFKVNKMILKNINRAIYYSYTVYGDFSKQYGISISDSDWDIIKSSITDRGYGYDDNISYFYTEYLINSESTFNVSFKDSIEAKKYVQDLYRKAFGENATKMFVFDLEQCDVPLLKSESAYYIYYYLYIGTDQSINEVAKEYYYAFDSSYSAMLSESEGLMIRSEPYYATHYMNYYNNNAVLGRCTNIALIISIVIGYCFTILAPKLIIKHERTIGRLIFKLGEISDDNEPITWKVTVINSIFECIGYMTIMFIMYMLKPFNGVFSAMYMPFIGEIPLLIILAVILLLVLVNGCVMLFTHNKVGINGLIAKSTLVDRNRLDEFESDED